MTSDSTSVFDLDKSVTARKPVAGMFVMQKGRLRYISKPLAEILGYSSAQAPTIGSFWELIHPDDRKRVRLGRKQELSGSKCVRVLRKDGGSIWVDIQASFLSQENGSIFVGCMIVNSDMESREWCRREHNCAEPCAQLSAVYSSVQDAIVAVSPEMIVIDANGSAEMFCGIDVHKPERRFAEFASPCAAACGRVLRQVLGQKQMVLDHRIICGLQSRYRTINASGVPLIDRLGNLLGATLVVRDMTSQRDLELRQRHEFKGIIGKDKRMQDIYRLVEDLADLENAILISGESGTGKKLIAKALHDNGCRAFGPFVAINCSLSDEKALEKQLFGHAKGAFMDMDQERPGMIECADGGTLLLEEVGRLSPSFQLKLLKVLQQKEIVRLNDVVPRKVDVRVIACTRQDLRQKVRLGEFREDLYFRLKDVEICTPPLRDKPEDIPLLAEHFLKRFNQKFGKEAQGLDSDALGLLMDYEWPGNVRELEHVIERALVLCDKKVVSLEHLPVGMQQHKATALKELFLDDAVMEDNAQHEILIALNKTLWNKSKAAQLIGISRQTLYRKMHEYGLL